MGFIELKSELLTIFEKIEEELLRTIYDFLKQCENAQIGPSFHSCYLSPLTNLSSSPKP